jgi:hypothetical protein
MIFIVNSLLGRIRNVSGKNKRGLSPMERKPLQA